MTQNEYKIGDRVRHLGYNLCGIITDFLGEGFVMVRAIDDEVFSTWDINNLELCDRKTAFLRELQALLRKYDATICGGLSDMHNDDVIYVSIGDDEIAYRNGEFGMSFASITADNIMDFDKE